MADKFIDVEELNLRSSPNASSPVNRIDTLFLGHPVEELGPASVAGWTEIKTKINGADHTGVVKSAIAGVPSLRDPVDPAREALVAQGIKEWLRFERGQGKEHHSPFSSSSAKCGRKSVWTWTARIAMCPGPPQPSHSWSATPGPIPRFRSITPSSLPPPTPGTCMIRSSSVTNATVVHHSGDSNCTRSGPRSATSSANGVSRGGISRTPGRATDSRATAISSSASVMIMCLPSAVMSAIRLASPDTKRRAWVFLPRSTRPSCLW